MDAEFGGMSSDLQVNAGSLTEDLHPFPSSRSSHQKLGYRFQSSGGDSEGRHGLGRDDVCKSVATVEGGRGWTSQLNRSVRTIILGPAGLKVDFCDLVHAIHGCKRRKDFIERVIKEG